MGVITGYPADASLSDDDNFLGPNNTGATSLYPASLINKYMGPGWTIAADSWSFSSYNSTTLIGVINANSGATTRYSAGMWFRFTQPTLGTKYAKVVSLTTSAVTLRFVGGTVLSNEAISSLYYSTDAQPLGAPVLASIDAQSIYNPFMFSVYRSAAWTAAGGDSKTPFDTKDFDNSNNFDITTNFRYNITVPGKYHFDAVTGYVPAASSDPIFASLFKNGSEWVRGNQNYTINGATTTVSVSDTLQLTTSDYVEVHLWNASGSGKPGNVSRLSARFSGYLESYL